MLLLFTTAHIIVEVAKALGGSFKLVMIAPKTVREMTQLLRETQKNGDIQRPVLHRDNLLTV